VHLTLLFIFVRRKCTKIIRTRSRTRQRIILTIWFNAYIYFKILHVCTSFAFLFWVISFFDLWPFHRKWNLLLLSWCFTTFISRQDRDENYIWIVKTLDKLSWADIFKLRESFYQVDSWNIRRYSMLEKQNTKLWIKT